MGRRWRWVAISVATALVLVAAGAVTAAWLLGRSVDHNLTRTNALAEVPSSARPTETVTSALNVLLLGSDSRNPGATASSRSDTMMLLHLDAGHRHAYAISIPRDTWVRIPASADGRHSATMAKINSAYARGGASLAVHTVEAFTGVRIDHVVVIDFAGFQQVVDALGGVDLTVDQTITSIFPPHRTFVQGRRHFTGAEALDYVRQRYQFADGDFARERHQQQFLQALLDKATASGTLTDISRLTGFLRAAARTVTVDQGFDLVDVALKVRHLRSGDITFLSSPSAGTDWEGDQSVVRPDTATAQALYAAMASDTLAQWLATSSASPQPMTNKPRPVTPSRSARPTPPVAPRRTVTPPLPVNPSGTGTASGTDSPSGTGSPSTSALPSALATPSPAAT
ncbi:LytR family transcriptional regulator [Planosporangium flavigriseum]|nr:LCP family protein [Planosporangium flavigriseum]NJC67574.1 LytR family transcriptional regulator [Planosporangium flavigriseum]